MTVLVAFVLAAIGIENAKPAPDPPSVISAEALADTVIPARSTTDANIQIAQATASPLPPTPPRSTSPLATPGVRRLPTPAPAPPIVRPRTIDPLRPGATALRDPNLFANTEGATGSRPFGDFSRGGIPQMIGDQGPFASLRIAAQTTTFPPNPLPKPPSARLASSLISSVRGFKIAENQSPRPQDRVFFSSNYFSNANAALNAKVDAPVRDVNVFRQIFGAEKTFDDGNGSIGIRLPLDTISAVSTVEGKFNKPGGTSTALGDLSIFAKYILKENRETGSLISAGLVVTPPTAGGKYAGANYIESINSLTLQPFLGYIWSQGDFYIQGFSALSVPSTVRDVTLIYNDIGLGYFLYRDSDPNQFLTAIVPTFEVHANIPLTHRDVFNANDSVGSPDVVNLTYGTSFEFYKQSVLTAALVTPVTSPKPFTYEVILQYNYRFGAGRRVVNSMTPPLPGG